MRLLVSLMLGSALLAACETTDLRREGALACAGYASALESLAVRREAGLLDDDTIARIDELRSIATPICTAENPPDGSTATLDAILVELEAILAKRAIGDEI